MERQAAIFYMAFFFFTFIILINLLEWRRARTWSEGKITGKNILICSTSVKIWYSNANVERNTKVFQAYTSISKENMGRKSQRNSTTRNARWPDKTRRLSIGTCSKKNATVKIIRFVRRRLLARGNTFPMFYQNSHKIIAIGGSNFPWRQISKKTRILYRK